MNESIGRHLIFELVHLAHPFCTLKSLRFPEGKWTSFPEGSGDPAAIFVLTDGLIGSWVDGLIG